MMEEERKKERPKRNPIKHPFIGDALLEITGKQNLAMTKSYLSTVFHV